MFIVSFGFLFDVCGEENKKSDIPEKYNIFFVFSEKNDEQLKYIGETIIQTSKIFEQNESINFDNIIISEKSVQISDIQEKFNKIISEIKGPIIVSNPYLSITDMPIHFMNHNMKCPICQDIDTINKVAKINRLQLLKLRYILLNSCNIYLYTKKYDEVVKTLVLGESIANSIEQIDGLSITEHVSFLVCLLDIIIKTHSSCPEQIRTQLDIILQRYLQYFENAVCNNVFLVRKEIVLQLFAFDLKDNDVFKERNIELDFIKNLCIRYPDFFNLDKDISESLLHSCPKTNRYICYVESILMFRKICKGKYDLIKKM
jgi:hypothetical protein